MPGAFGSASRPQAGSERRGLVTDCVKRGSWRQRFAAAHTTRLHVAGSFRRLSLRTTMQAPSPAYAERAGCDLREFLGNAAVKGGELVHELRPCHHRPTRRHAASRAMPPQRLGWSVGISPAFWVAFDSCTASTTGVAVDDFCTTGSTSAISSSSVLIAFRSKEIERSLFPEKCWRVS